MALADVVIYDDGICGFPGSKRFKVNNGGPLAINAGELVLIVQGDQVTAGNAGKGSYVTRWTVSNTAKPVVGTDYIAGLAASSSTETLTAKGIVDVFVNLPGMTYLGNPDTAATWNTQTKYDLLVGARVFVSTTSAGVQTILATDTGGAKPKNNAAGTAMAGLIVEPLDVIKYPGKVRFSLNQNLNYTNQANI